MGKRILLLGIGHIGSKFIHSLEAGVFDEVRIIDNLSTQRYSSLFNLPSNINFSFHEGDIESREFTRLVSGVDSVIHLAAITDAESSIHDPEGVFRTNLNGTKIVAMACLEHGVRCFFLQPLASMAVKT